MKRKRRDPAEVLGTIIILIRRLEWSDRRRVFRALLAWFNGEGTP